MTNTNIKDRINKRGLAHGWHAEQLQAKAVRGEAKMADIFKESVDDSIAFNVPAECVKVSGRKAYYKFMDGSEAMFVLPEKVHDS